MIAGDLMDGGVDPRQLTRQLSGYWRDALVGRSRQKPVAEPRVAKCRSDQIVPVLYSLMGVESATRRSDSPRWALETAIADATLRLAGGEDTSQPATPAGPPTIARPAEHVPAAEPLAATMPTHAQADDQASLAYPSPLAPAPPLPNPILDQPLLDVVLDQAASTEPSFFEQESEQAGAKPATEQPGTVLEIPDGPPAPNRATSAGAAPNLRALWPQVMRRLNENRKVQVYSLLQKVVLDAISAENGVASLPILQSDSFVRSRLESPAIKKVVEETISAVLGGRWGVRCVTIDTKVSSPTSSIDDLDYLEQIAAEASGHNGEPNRGV
jgi:hypothetical protein